MMMNILIFYIMFFVGNLIFILQRKHLMVVLLGLEFIILSIFFFFMVILNLFEFNLYILMIFLVFSVCEGVLGLSILVSMVRTHGNDYFNSYTLL
uniref:NADH-ubiquinone oxidoreductase chain 4L n=1 Tax=Cameraria ohridella TaxID=199129 RepID=A0A076EBD7_9NEOP|nr:NADH dehydrogenase subunit 4L [Cameraria ohridella]